MPAGVHIGTSGWHYPHWRGVFYPEDLPAAQWLPFYARHFSCVEINNSFYRLPERETFDHWRTQTPPGFAFAVKAPQGITHRKKLKVCTDTLQRFLEHAAVLEEKLAVILFQLPPRWRCNPQRLEDFLRWLPAGLRYTFEFRDPSWHDPAVYALLETYGAAFCLFELGDFRAPLTVTTDFVYVRLHGPAGPYAGSYSAARLRTWGERLRGWQRQGHSVWVFFDNDEAGHAVKNARLLRRLMERR